jgi:hypothetical protein
MQAATAATTATVAKHAASDSPPALGLVLLKLNGFALLGVIGRHKRIKPDC